MSAIEATSVNVKTLADGTLRLSVDIEPMHAQAAFALFGRPGQPMALAAIKPASSAPAPADQDRPKGGDLAKWVAMRCAEPAFQQWLRETFPGQWRDAIGVADVSKAASVVRAVCSIESRAELDNNAIVAGRFHSLIRKPYMERKA